MLWELADPLTILKECWEAADRADIQIITEASVGPTITFW